MYRNRITVVGRMTADPEIRSTPKGKRVAQFSLAQNYRIGEEGSEVNYFEVEAWEPFVKYIEANGEKGKPTYVEGHIKTNRWEDKQTGEKRSRQTVVVDYFHFISLSELADMEGKSGQSDHELDQTDAGG